MPTTSNFGWTTPADTDLVKDGAAAIRTLGNGIDASLVDLKGGTTGQILSKNSNTDLDYTWINNDQGDITEVQAGTGISVASGTGPVPVVTNTVATTFDAKGDLVVGTGADTFAKLTVGTNGHTLVADSAETTGLKWAAPAGGSGPAFQATMSSSQTISAGVYTKLQFDNEVFDTDSCYDPTTNYRFTPNKAGYYEVTGTAIIYRSAGGVVGTYILRLYKNGSLAKVLYAYNTSDFQDGGTFMIYLNGTTDYIELFGYGDGGGTNQTAEGGAATAYPVFQAFFVRS